MSSYDITRRGKRGQIARENVAKARKANALEVQAESEELCAKSTLQKAQEMAMKQELVRQLRVTSLLIFVYRSNVKKYIL